MRYRWYRPAWLAFDVACAHSGGAHIHLIQAASVDQAGNVHASITASTRPKLAEPARDPQARQELPDRRPGTRFGDHILQDAR